MLKVELVEEWVLKVHVSMSELNHTQGAEQREQSRAVCDQVTQPSVPLQEPAVLTDSGPEQGATEVTPPVQSEVAGPPGGIPTGNKIRPPTF